MEMTRRWFLTGLPAALTTAACGARTVAVEQGTYHEIQAVGRGSEKVLVCMPDTPQTREVWRSLSDELGQEFQVVAARVERRSDRELVREAIARHSPSALVLMNNPTVAAYKAYLATTPNAKPLATVVVMTSFIEQKALLSLGAAGISYEVPLITAVTNLRRILQSPVDRVGVVYRKPLVGFVRRQQGLASREKVRVVEAQVSATPNESELRKALRDVKQRADAIWVLNDDRLLTPRLITAGWVPGLNERPWRPAIVGAASLVSEAQSLGMLAVLPDHTALGVQVADMVYDIADNDWVVPRKEATELPLSTTTTVDLNLATERFELRSDALAQVDRVIN